MNNYKGPALRRHIEEAHLRRHIWGGTFESNLRMFEAHFNPKKREIATFTWFATKARMLLSKILPQTSRNFTQIYLPYLRHYQTLHWGGTLRRHTWGGTFESNLRMFEAHFNLLPVKSASSDSYLPPTMVAVIDNLMDRGGAYWNLMPTVAPLYMMRYWGRHKNILSEKIQTSETHLGGA